jgi:Flp pilus assembly protein TadD
MSLGLAQLGAGKAVEALQTFDEAVKLDPKLPALGTSHALALIALKKTSEAESELLKSISESPNDSRPVAALADFYLANDKTLDKALTYANKAAMMAPNSAAAELLVGKVEKSRKNYQAAVKAIGEAVKMAPEWGEAWYALGVTYEEAGDKANAEKAYRKLVEKQPKAPDSLMTLASFLADGGKKDEATELIDKVRALNPPKEVLDAAQALQDKIEGKKQPK